MALTTTTVRRVFVYNEREYPDPSPAASPDEVKGILASSGFPELTNGAVVGPHYTDGKEIYTLKALTQHKG